MGRLYARIAATLPTTQLVAVAGNSEASVTAAAQERQVPGYHGGDYRRMLDAHPEIDAVVVATPEWLHLDPARTVMEAGKHLLLEKPMATTLPDAQQIAAIAASTGVTLMICHQLRFDPRFALAREVVQRGDIGDVLHLHARRLTTATAAARVMGKIPLTCWISPHDLDMLPWIAGSRVTHVTAHTRGDAREPVDFFIATMRFASGAVATFEQSWGVPPLGGRPRNTLFDVRGTKGAIEVTLNETGLAIYGAGTATYPTVFDSVFAHGQVSGAFPALLSHFVTCVTTGQQPLIGASEGLDTITLADAMSRSIRERREVEVEG